jgi:hypothetical protein
MPDEIVDVAVGNIIYATLATGPFTTSTISTSGSTTHYAPTSWTTTTGTITGGFMNPATVYYDPPRPEPTPEERAAFDRQQEELRQRERARRAERNAATARAEELLLMMLDEVQAAQYRMARTFDLVGSLGGRYRIHPGTMGNVDALDADGEWVGALCAHPTGGLPLPDVALAQMLHITTDERDFVATANVHRGRRPRIV